MDKIYIRDLEFIGYHGVFEEEKKLGQKFYLSLELSTDLREANDDITKTTHYGEVAETVKKIFFQKKYDLIETLAEDIAREVLTELLAIEIRMGRERKIKWGPRIIDLDIIFYNKEVIEEDDLIVPHPYMEYRDFVLKPLEEIIPNFVHPLLLKRISTLKKELENEKN